MTTDCTELTCPRHGSENRAKHERTESLADWLGEQPESHNVFDITDEATTYINIPVEHLAERIVASGWTPPTEEPACSCPYTDPSTWLSAASCGYGGGYEPGSMQEWDPDCPVHPPTAVPPADANAPGLREALRKAVDLVRAMRPATDVSQLPDPAMLEACARRRGMNDALEVFPALLATQPDKAEGEA